MRCKNCGVEVNEEYDYCMQCGAKIEKAMQRKVLKKEYLIAFALLVVVVVGVVVLSNNDLFVHTDGEEEEREAYTISYDGNLKTISSIGNDIGNIIDIKGTDVIKAEVLTQSVSLAVEGLYRNCFTYETLSEEELMEYKHMIQISFNREEKEVLREIIDERCEGDVRIRMLDFFDLLGE